MSAVNLNQIESGVDGATRPGNEVRDDLIHAGAVEFYGKPVWFVEWDSRGSHWLPATFGGRNKACLLPRNGHACLATGMRELNPCVSPMLMQKVGDALEPWNVFVFIYAKILRRDAAFRIDRTGFCDH